MKITRRALFRFGLSAGATGVAGRFSRFGLWNALAQDAYDYKALVCLFLFGGNDSNNLIVPLETREYNAYKLLRRGLALEASTLLPVNALTGGAAYGFHPKLSELRQSYVNGRLAVVANVGTLVAPVTRPQYLAGAAVPSNLFSHLDQQTEWQTASPQATAATGWAGRLADRIAGWNAPPAFPAFISVSGSQILGQGERTQPGTVIPGRGLGPAGFNTSAASQARFRGLQQILTFDTGMTLVHAANSILEQGLQDDARLSKALQGLPALQTVFPATGIGQQLQQVARLIQARQQLGMRRQLFFASLGGFDTHIGQLATQESLFTQLSTAVSAFENATLELGVDQQVTLFTESDFNRTFQPNGNAGTDHAWGGHHIVLGGAVRGGDIYGRFPTFELGGPDDAASEGRWIPSVSVDQYAATLAAWFGVDADGLTAVFPNLSNFETRNLGFLP
ncbi:MAG: DUF1501 domain-containing protein [Bryobacterales bacterium]|nr:DUF1501 domain-containing protein [Bryobacterales bacterium]